jgi:hypothetical protein
MCRFWYYYFNSNIKLYVWSCGFLYPTEKKTTFIFCQVKQTHTIPVQINTKKLIWKHIHMFSKKWGKKKSTNKHLTWLTINICQAQKKNKTEQKQPQDPTLFLPIIFFFVWSVFNWIGEITQNYITKRLFKKFTYFFG